MKFVISSRADVQKKVSAVMDDNPIVISILDTLRDSPNYGDIWGLLPTENSGAHIPLLNMRFDDVDAADLSGQIMAARESNVRLITDKDARDIVKFVAQRPGNCRVIVIHCAGGISRSAGAAAALSKGMNHSDSWVFEQTDLYRPNMYVYRKVYEAFNDFGSGAKERVYYKCVLTGEDIWHQFLEWGFTEGEVKEFIYQHGDDICYSLDKVMSSLTEDWGDHFCCYLRDHLAGCYGKDDSETNKVATQIINTIVRRNNNTIRRDNEIHNP